MVEREGARERASVLAAHPWWLAWDVFAVLAFVAIGRAVHDHGVSVTGMVSTAWSFLTGLGLGWWLVVARRWNGAHVGAALVVVTATVVVGMALRAVTGQGTAVAFVIVTVCFVGLFLLGPRVAVIRRRSRVGGRPAAED